MLDHSHGASPPPGYRCPAFLAAFDGAILCVLGRHTLWGLANLPPVLMLCVAGLFAFALARCKHPWRLLPWFAAGVALALELPPSLAPLRASVMTHAPARFMHADLFDALEQLDENPGALVGRRITVSGLWRSSRGHVPATVSRRVMACCAADAVDVGFDVVPAARVIAGDGTSVRVSGTVQVKLSDGETRYGLRNATVSTL